MTPLFKILNLLSPSERSKSCLLEKVPKFLGSAHLKLPRMLHNNRGEGGCMELMYLRGESLILN